MCISATALVAALEPPYFLWINVQSVPGWAETSEFGSPADCLSPRAGYLTQVSCGRKQGQCKEKNVVKYSQVLFWQMATLAFWTLMGKTDVLSVKIQIAKNKTVIYGFFCLFVF